MAFQFFLPQVFFVTLLFTFDLCKAATAWVSLPTPLQLNEKPMHEFADGHCTTCNPKPASWLANHACSFVITFIIGMRSNISFFLRIHIYNPWRLMTRLIVADLLQPLYKSACNLHTEKVQFVSFNKGWLSYAEIVSSCRYVALLVGPGDSGSLASERCFARWIILYLAVIRLALPVPL